MTSPRSLPLVALALAVAVLLVQARVIAGGNTWDDIRYHTEFAPPRLAAAELVQHGALPTWWDGSGLGVPLAAEPQHGAVYPLTWIASTPRGLDYVLILHLAWAAFGVAVWARRKERASDPAALVAGILVASSGILASAALRGALPALAHLPWLGVAAGMLESAQDRRGRARAAIAIAVLLGLVGLGGELAVLVDALALVIVLTVRRVPVGWLAAGIGGGLAVSAAQWLPAALALVANERSGAIQHGLPLARIVELIVPGSFGSFDPDRSIATLCGAAPWAPSLFIGAPLLALAAVTTPARRLLGVIFALIALALVTGRGGWPAWLGAPELHIAALALVLGAHAGTGLDALLAGKRRAVLALAVGAGCTVLALGALGALRGRHPDAAPAIDRALLDGGLGVACIAVVIGLAWRVPKKAMPFVLALLVLPGVGAMNSVAPVAPRALVDEPSPWVTAAEAAPRPARVFRPVIMPDVPDTLADGLATLRGASPWKWGIASARSEDPARLPDHDEVWLAAAREGGALLDRFSIELAILPSTVVGANKMTELGKRGRWSLVSLPVAPVASVLRGWVWAVAPRDAMDLMFAAGGGTNVLRGTVVLNGGGESRGDRGPPVPCSITTWDAGDIDLVCTPDSDGYAVVTSSPAAGWTVTVDGNAADWLTADVLRRAVKIDAGMRHVQWRYAAPGMRAGLVLALVGLLGLLALWLGTRKVPPPADVN